MIGHKAVERLRHRERERVRFSVCWGREQSHYHKLVIPVTSFSPIVSLPDTWNVAKESFMVKLAVKRPSKDEKQR